MSAVKRASRPAPKFAPSPVDLEQAEQLFMQIALLAHNVDRACFFAPHGRSDDPDDIEQDELELGQLRHAVNLIGWMADIGAAKLGGKMQALRGGAEEWLLSPRYLAIAERAQEVSHG